MTKPLHKLDLTLALIVKNEEKHLRNCLSTFQGLWKHLLIVDTGSTDKTINVAKEFEAEIKHFKWIKDFSAARNFTLDQVKTKWVMMIDADDIIMDYDRDQLAEDLNKLNQTKTDIILMPYYYSGGRHNPITTLILPKIWKNSLKLKYENPIHEYLQYKIDHSKKLNLGIPIVHNKVQSEQNSAQRNLELLLNYHQQKPDNTRTVLYLGMENDILNNSQEAIKYYKKYIQMNPQNKEELGFALTKLGLLLLKQGKHADAKQNFEAAISTTPHFIDAYLWLAEMEMNLFSTKRAIQLLAIAKELKPPKTILPYNPGFYNGPASKLYNLAVSKLR